MIFLFQKCDTFGRTAKGRTWLASQDHPHYTQLIWTSTIKINIIDSQFFELSKIKSIAFDRNSPSGRVKPSVTHATKWTNNDGIIIVRSRLGLLTAQWSE